MADKDGESESKTGVFRPDTLVSLIFGFWAVWWSVVFTTNAFDGLVRIGVLEEGWTFASGNYAFLRDVASVHGTPESVVALLFVGGVFWELTVAALAWRGFVAAALGSLSERHVYAAFVPAVGFFAAFLVLTEVFVAYDLAHTLAQLFVAVLVSTVTVEYLRRSN